MAAHLGHFPLVGTQERCGRAGRVRMAPGVPLQAPGEKNQPDRNQSQSRGEGKKPGVLGNCPLSGQWGKGEGQLPPRCHIPHSGKTGCLSLPPYPSREGLGVRDQAHASLHTKRGAFLCLCPGPGALRAPFGAPCQASAHPTWAGTLGGPDAGQAERRMSGVCPDSIWMVLGSLSSQLTSFPPGKQCCLPRGQRL